MHKGPLDATCQIENVCVNTIRTLSMDAVQAANSGHPGAPMGLAAAAYVLWTRVLKHNPQNPGWRDRDRFVLSGGHASMLLYSVLYLTGYDVSLEDIKQFRQWGSKTPGHPEYRHTPGVETTTGPLGQGIANAVGMAMAEAHLAAKFNRPEFHIVDHHTYVMCGDGDMMEGLSAEAASLAGHLGLGKLICIYDDNKISIEGSTAIAFTEDVAQRFAAYKWHVVHVEDGNDLDAIQKALQAARDEDRRPSLIVLRTHIAYGSPNKQDTADAHGAPLGEEEVRLTKQCLGYNPDDVFCVSDEVLDHYRKCLAAGSAAEKDWEALYADYQAQYPELAQDYEAAMTGALAPGWEEALPVFDPEDGPLATRAASGTVLNAVAAKIPYLVGGSADLAPSNKTFITHSHEFQAGAYDGRNVRFGVREHAMGAIMSGMALHGGIRAYGGTFLVFADYMRPAIRLAALMRLPVIYVFTHDSVAVGEDGPTHQPIEHLASLRAIPNLTVVRPSDATETVEAWRIALQRKGPVALILSRQKLPILDRQELAPAAGLAQGAYILADSDGPPEVILMASGSEVSQALEASQQLRDQSVAVRVVSMPSWELFEQAPADYRARVLPPNVARRVAVEAGSPFGWERYAGERGVVIGIETFGASAPGAEVMQRLGITSAKIVETVEALLHR